MCETCYQVKSSDEIYQDHAYSFLAIWIDNLLVIGLVGADGILRAACAIWYLVDSTEVFCQQTVVEYVETHSQEFEGRLW